MSIIKSPDHYAEWAIEPIVFIMGNDMSFWRGNVIKYVLRHKDKDGLQDLLKAKRYIEFLINTYGDSNG